MTMDYRALLLKYLSFIDSYEGTTFLNLAGKQDFTREELAELKRLCDENDGGVS